MDDQLRREAILRAARAIFCHVGYEAATTLDIARQAHVSKRDLYRLFQNKQGILDEVVATSTIDMLAPKPIARAATRQELLDGLQAFGRSFLAGLLQPDKIALLRVAIASAPKSTRVAEAIRSSGIHSITASLAPLMADAVQHRLLEPHKSTTVVEVFFETLVGRVLIESLLSMREPPDQEMIRARSRRAVDIVASLLDGRA